jgi:molecular chaperone HtpG
MQFEEPLFHIHLKLDPFNFNFIFPKLSGDLQIQKDKIQLYQTKCTLPIT